MSRLEIYRKQAKQLVRWHRAGNHSIGGRIRGLSRYRTLSDGEALALPFPLHEAQEIVAMEAGFATWTELKAAADASSTTTAQRSATTRLTRAIPVLLVRDVQAAATFFRDTLGFRIDFLHGEPPFYGAVSRDTACLHLKCVHTPTLVPDTGDDEGLITAFVEVDNVKALYAEYIGAGVTFAQALKQQAWGGRDFIVRAPDGNAIAFVEMRR